MGGHGTRNRPAANCIIGVLLLTGLPTSQGLSGNQWTAIETPTVEGDENTQSQNDEICLATPEDDVCVPDPCRFVLGECPPTPPSIGQCGGQDVGVVIDGEEFCFDSDPCSYPGNIVDECPPSPPSVGLCGGQDVGVVIDDEELCFDSDPCSYPEIMGDECPPPLPLTHLGLCSIVINEDGVDIPIFDGKEPVDVVDQLLTTGQIPVVDLIVVSLAGQGDPRIPGNIVQLACTPEEYRMLYPDTREFTGDIGYGVSSSAPIADVVDSALFDAKLDTGVLEEIEAMIARGHYPVYAEDHALAESIGFMCFEPRGECPEELPCSGLECLDYGCEDACLPPWDPSCEGFDCLPCDSWNDCLGLDPDVHLNPDPKPCEFVPSKLQEHCMDEQTQTQEISLLSNHAATVTIVFPADGDPQQPEGRCNEAYTIDAVGNLESDFGVGIDVICYDQVGGVNLDQHAWRPSANGEIKDTGNLLESCSDHVTDHLIWLIGGLDRIVCWVRQGTNNGIAERPGSFALVTERPSWWRFNMPDVPLTLHEVLHTYDAVHYPDDSIKKNLCGVWVRVGSFPFAFFVYVSFESVMNYCHMYRGSTHIDNMNMDRVKQYTGW